MRYFQKIINYSQKKFNAKGYMPDLFVSNIDTSYLYPEEPEANQHRVKQPLEAADRMSDLSTGVKPFGKSIVPVFDPGSAGNSDTEVSSKEAKYGMFDSRNASDLDFGGLQFDKAEKLKSETQRSESSDGEETSSLKGSHSGPIADINLRNSVNYNQDNERLIKGNQPEDDLVGPDDPNDPDLLLFGKNHDAKNSEPEIKSYSNLHPVTVSEDKTITKTDDKTLEPAMHDNRPATTPEKIKTSGRVSPEKGILPKGFAQALQQVQPELLQLPKPVSERGNVLHKLEEPAVSPATSQAVYIGRVSVTVKRKEKEAIQENYSSAFISAKPELSRYFMGDA